MNPSMYFGGQQGAPGAGEAPSKDVRPPPRRQADSFADLWVTNPDPLLAERRHRLRRIVGGVMAGAVALIVLAGISGMIRRTEPDATLATAEPSVPAANAPSTVMPPPAPSADTIGSQTATTTRPDRLARPHRPKAAPLRKTRNWSAGGLPYNRLP
jgi:hypothetical protein